LTTSNAHCLRENVLRNGAADRIMVTQAAVSDKRGEVPLTDNGPYSSSSAEADLMCPAVTLDDYLEEPVAFLKVDTEGYEPHVFAGARHFLERHRPLVLSEFNGWWYIEHGYSSIVFAEALYGFADILGIYHQEAFLPAPANGVELAWVNLTQHASITDVLLRPRSMVPSLRDMTDASVRFKINRPSPDSVNFAAGSRR
jgi:FkbM family methyltransferase